MTCKFLRKTWLLPVSLCFALCAFGQSDGPLRRVNLDSQKAASMAKRVLQDEEFTTKREETLMERLSRRLAEWLGKVFSSNGSAPASAGNAFETAARVIVVVLVALLIVLIVWALAAFWLKPAQIYKAESFDERRAPYEQLLAWAKAAEENGEYSRAFTFYFWAALKKCDRCCWLDYSDDRTNWEVLSTAKSAAPTFWELLRERGREFDGFHYGGRNATSENVSEIRNLLHDIPDEALAA